MPTPKTPLRPLVALWRLPILLKLVVLVLVLVASGLAWDRIDNRARENHNADVVARACDGALPVRTVDAIAPDGARARLTDNRGTVLGAGYSHRDLLTCEIEWETDGGPRNGATVATSLGLMATPLRSTPIENGVRVSDLVDEPLTPGVNPVLDTGQGLVARCPKGLTGIGRQLTGDKVTYFSVRASGEGGKRQRLALERAAARHILKKAGCAPGPGTTGPRVRQRAIERYEDSGAKDGDQEDPRACEWFDPDRLGIASGSGWQDPSPSEWRREIHGCTVEHKAEQSAHALGDAHQLSSGRWQGPYLAEARTEHASDLRLLSPSDPSPRGGRRADDYRLSPRERELVLWAEARCDGEKSLIRLSAEVCAPTPSPASSNGP